MSASSVGSGSPTASACKGLPGSKAGNASPEHVKAKVKKAEKSDEPEQEEEEEQNDNVKRANVEDAGQEPAAQAVDAPNVEDAGQEPAAQAVDAPVPDPVPGRLIPEPVPVASTDQTEAPREEPAASTH